MKKSLMYLLNTFFHSEFCYLTVPWNYKECILSAFVLVTICKTRCNSGAVLSDVGRSQLYSPSLSTFVTHRLAERTGGKDCDSNFLIIRPPIQCKVDYFFHNNNHEIAIHYARLTQFLWIIRSSSFGSTINEIFYWK